MCSNGKPAGSKRSQPVIARVFSEAIFFIMPDSIKVIVMDKLYLLAGSGLQPEPMGLLWNWGLGAINGGIGHIKREVQVTNLNPP